MWVYVLIYSVQFFLLHFISWFFAIKYIQFKKIRFCQALNCLKQSLYYFIPSLIVGFASVIDKTMIGIMCNSFEVGYYEEASKIFILIVGLISSIAPVFLSHITSLISQNNLEKARKSLFTLFECYFIISIPSLFGLYIIADLFIPTFFGIQYTKSVPIMYALTPALIFNSVY